MTLTQGSLARGQAPHSSPVLKIVGGGYTDVDAPGQLAVPDRQTTRLRRFTKGVNVNGQWYVIAIGGYRHAPRPHKPGKIAVCVIMK